MYRLEKIKLSLYADDIIVCLEYLKKFHVRELISKVIQVTRDMIKKIVI